MYALGAKKTLGYVSTAAGFDVVGQLVQGGEYRPGQTVLAAQTTLAFGPLFGSSIKGNAIFGAGAGGSNVATNNFYYDENKDVARGAFWGMVTGGLATASGNAINNSLKGAPSSVEIPFFQTPATISVQLPLVSTVGNSVETAVQNAPAFIPLPERGIKPNENNEVSGNGDQ